MAKTQPGGLYKSPDGRFHDAWNRPVGGQIDTPFPGSDQYRAHEQRAREQLEAIDKEQERLAKDYALRAHQVLGCRGVSRVDMIVA